MSVDLSNFEVHYCILVYYKYTPLIVYNISWFKHTPPFRIIIVVYVVSLLLCFVGGWIKKTRQPSCLALGRRKGFQGGCRTRVQLTGTKSQPWGCLCPTLGPIRFVREWRQHSQTILADRKQCRFGCVLVGVSGVCRGDIFLKVLAVINLLDAQQQVTISIHWILYWQ